MACSARVLLTSLLLGLFSWGLVEADVITFKPCDNDVGASKITEIRLQNCSQVPCTLKRGEKYLFEVDFTSDKEVKNMKIEAFGILVGMSIAWENMDTDACSNKYNLKCPLLKDKKYTYKNEINVAAMYPSIPVTTKWIFTEDGKKTACFLVDIVIA